MTSQQRRDGPGALVNPLAMQRVNPVMHSSLVLPTPTKQCRHQNRLIHRITGSIPLADFALEADGCTFTNPKDICQFPLQSQ